MSVGYAIPAVLNAISTITILVGLISIKKFVKRHGVWEWSKNGLFAIHLFLFTALTIVEALTLVVAIYSDYGANPKLEILQIAYTCVNFFATGFIIYLIWQFS